MTAVSFNPVRKPVIALVNIDAPVFQLIADCQFNDFSLLYFENGIELSKQWESRKLPVAAIISQSEILGSSGISLFQTLINKRFPYVPFFIITDHPTEILLRIALQSGITDVFSPAVKADALKKRVEFMSINWKTIHKSSNIHKLRVYKTPIATRIFDILVASVALIILSPVLLLIIIALKLEHKGPFLYYSLRVGTSYNVFKFYKFRSMYVNADKKIKDIRHLNQYANKLAKVSTSDEPALCNECRVLGTVCRFNLYADNNVWCEKQYRLSGMGNGNAAFFKLKNDPRVTTIGKILRNTSMDELPQLVNVLIGNMSIVGNRPLPLYEAEKLTVDKHAIRFMAPAGITGLWQVVKRGKGDMSEEERLLLDNEYAQNHSFLNDLRLICKTIPALFQKENV
ncbi:MAG: sugar transferase [Chitinophagaceae bacterium]